MQGFDSAFNCAVDQFCGEYPELRESAKLHLNGLYRDLDYPDVERVRGKFAFAVSFQPVPTSGDLRVDIDHAHLEAIKEQIQGASDKRLREACGDLWRRLYDAVGHLCAKLKDPKGQFKNSTVENISELCGLLPKLNLTADPELDRMVREVQSKIAGATAEELRINPRVRETVANDSSAILSAMGAFMGAL